MAYIFSHCEYFANLYFFISFTVDARYSRAVVINWSDFAQREYWAMSGNIFYCHYCMTGDV